MKRQLSFASFSWSILHKVSICVPYPLLISIKKAWILLQIDRTGFCIWVEHERGVWGWNGAFAWNG